MHNWTNAEQQETQNIWIFIAAKFPNTLAKNQRKLDSSKDLNVLWNRERLVVADESAAEFIQSIVTQDRVLPRHRLFYN